MKPNIIKNKLYLTSANFVREGYWDRPIIQQFTPKKSDLDLFDQDGYDLTELEKKYSEYNNFKYFSHGEHRSALKQNWFEQEEKQEGSILNHSLLFERKGYKDDALAQLQRWAKHLPLVYKIIAIKPKWGLDFSIDWVDKKGNVFEVLHWEFDGFNINEIEDVKCKFEKTVIDIDWDDAGKSILKHKDEWYHLDCFEQSNWKCNFFGVVKDRYGMVIWS